MIILVSITSPEFITTAPLGILYVGGALKQAGHHVEVLHFTPDEIDRRAAEIAAKNPLFVGISAFTCSQTKFSAELSRKIKARSSAPIVWGGVHSSLVPEQTLSEAFVDMVVIGEGEETAVELAAALENGRALGEVKSIGYKQDGRLVFTGERRLIDDLDRYRIDWDLIDIERYLVPMWGRRRVINFVTSRGCQFKCGFCYNLKFNRGHWRGHSTQFVLNELQNLKERYGVDGVRFYDDNLFGRKQRALEILEKMDLPWEGEFRVGYINDELARKLAETKCQGICFGIESGNDRILKLINKGQSVEDIVRGVEVMANYPQIRFSATLILANPTETRQEVINTVNTCLKLWRLHPRIQVSLGTFLPFPGVPLYDEVIKSGYLPPQRTEDWEVLNRTYRKRDLPWAPWVTDKDQEDFIRATRYALLLSLGNLRVPLINKIPYWRLAHYNFALPLELPALEWLERKFEDRQSWLSRMMRRMLPYLTHRGRLAGYET